MRSGCKDVIVRYRESEQLHENRSEHKRRTALGTHAPGMLCQRGLTEEGTPEAYRI
jgi:hypothetical protein